MSEKPAHPNTSGTWLAWGLLLLLALVWGSSFILIKKSLLTYSVSEVAAGRVFFAFLFFIPVLIRSWKTIPKPLMGHFFTSGMLGYLMPAFFFAIAQSKINSALAGTLNAVSPMFTMLIGILFFAKSTHRMQVVGLVIALAGALMLVFTRGGVAMPVINYYALYIVLATVCYGTNINIVSHYYSQLPAVVSTAWIFAGVGPVAFGILLFTNFFEKIVDPVNLIPSSYLLSLGVLASGLMSVIFNRIIQITSAVFAASVTYLMPIVALSWGLLDGEFIGLQQWLGTAVILIGVYLINRRTKTRKALLNIESTL
ncbi:DMT family transporter [Salmonirosea aquatica]|uniref:EamA family transporter n=1 Tax=Salmonirosea aquatica TaxID=2654236 RepID=A0A7C9BCQ7_9BACT|nr:EamA family transporter [Cytophagaceae bacterium SJW1-29]